MQSIPSIRNGSKWRWISILVLALIAVLTRVTSIGSESLHYDEAYAVFVAGNKNIPAILAGYPELSPHPPLYFLVLKVWTSVFGTAESSVRFPSAMFGVVSVLLLYAIGRTLFDHRAALVSAIVLTFSEFHIFHSQNARMYSLLSALTLASVYFYLRSTENPTRLKLLGYAVSTILLLYTHIFGVFVLLAEIVYNVTAGRVFSEARRVERPQWLRLLGIVALAYGPLFTLQVKQVLFIDESGALIGWVDLPSFGTVAVAFLSYIGYQPNTLVLLLRSLPFVLIIGAILFLWANNKRFRTITRSIKHFVRSPEANDGIYFLVVWIGTIHAIPLVLSYLVTPIYFTRVTISASLAVFLLIGLGVSRLKSSHLQYGITVVLLVSLLVPLGGYYTEHQRDEWNETADYIDSHASANATVVLVSDSVESADLRIPFRYYSDRSDLDLRAIGTKNPKVESRVRSLADNNSRMWVVFGRSHSLGTGNVRTITELLEERCDLSRSEAFINIDVKSYECSATGRQPQTRENPRFVVAIAPIGFIGH